MIKLKVDCDNNQQYRLVDDHFDDFRKGYYMNYSDMHFDKDYSDSYFDQYYLDKYYLDILDKVRSNQNLSIFEIEIG